MMVETPNNAVGAGKINSPQPLPSSVARLWRPAAQRNLRNQWPKLASYRAEWASASSTGKSNATSLVNAYLSQTYMPSMELGVLNEMPDIRKKACLKLVKQQELYQRKLLSAYKGMVTIVTHMVNTSRSMRCYPKGTSSTSIVQFSSSSEDSNNDTGDGAGIPVFTFWPISSFEQLAEELVQMFIFELNLKRLLVVELLAISAEVSQDHELFWSNELYPGEFDDLSVCNLYSKETCKPIPPRLMEGKCDMPARLKNQPNHETLQVYLTIWLAEVNIDAHRSDEIFAMIGEEMHVNVS